MVLGVKDAIQCYLQNCTQLNQCTELEVAPRIYALCQKTILNLCTGAKAANEMLVNPLNPGG